MILYIYISYSSCFCEIWALCVSWITYDYLYYAPYLACWALFGSFVSAMCNRTSCTQVHELPQSHCDDNREGILFSWYYTYYAHLASGRFEDSVCHEHNSTVYNKCIFIRLDKVALFSCRFVYTVCLAFVNSHDSITYIKHVSFSGSNWFLIATNVNKSFISDYK